MKNIDFEPMVSVIILNYNGKQHLKECFESLQQINYKNYELIFVDNASTDGSTEFMINHFDGVKHVLLDQNYGFAEGNNIGAKAADGEYIVFLNNDTAVDTNWLSELVNAAKMCSKDYIYTSKILFYDNPKLINTVGGKITPIGAGFDIGFMDKDGDAYNKMKYVGTPSGCSMFLKKSIYIQMGGFDKDYFAYFEDVDFGWRCWLSGYKVCFVPTSVVLHKFGSTGGKRNSPFRILYGQKNRLGNMVKNFSVINLIIGFCASMVYDIVRVIGFILNNHFDLVYALIKGNDYFLKELPHTYQKRKYIQSNRKLTDAEMYEMGIITSFSEGFKYYLNADYEK